MSRAERKQSYFNKISKLINEYNKILIVGADNVGSFHMQSIRKSLRGKATILMGKNTLVRKGIRAEAENHPKLQSILPYIKNNVGLIFCNGDLSEIRKLVVSNRVSAPAKIGSISPNDAVIPAGPTGMEPTMTNFLQALNIPSKINKGQVDILNDFKILSAGQRVGQSEATLLSKLNIKPFSYGLVIQTVYEDGNVYDSAVLDLSDQDIINKFFSGVSKVAALSLSTGYPTVAALPHVFGRGYRKVLSIALATDYSFPLADKLKHATSRPDAGRRLRPHLQAAPHRRLRRRQEQPPPALH